MSPQETAAYLRDRLDIEGKREVECREAIRLLSLPRVQRPRIYGFWDDGDRGQRVSITSEEVLYALGPEFILLMWTMKSYRGLDKD